jgi:hypothetical protein
VNDALFCSIHVDSAFGRDEMASLVAASTGGVVARHGVDCSWARVAVDDDHGDFEARQRDRDDFLGWKTLLEVMPHDGAERNEVVRGVTLLMNALIVQGLRVLAQAEYVDELPGGGEIVSPVRSLD